MQRHAAKAPSQDLALPKHVAVIMDGNGRWAKQRGLPRLAGHREGAKALRALLQNCGELGIPYVTVYAFSAENWTRPREEVTGLMELLRVYLGSEIKSLKSNGIRVRFVGDRSQLSEDLRRLIDEAERDTSTGEGMHLFVALSYGGRQELVHAARILAEEVRLGALTAEEITPETFRRALYAPDVPDPDLLIRTGGEHRISNFLLWQVAYTELFFTPVLWPDFGSDALNQALAEYATRERRFGDVEAKG